MRLAITTQNSGWASREGESLVRAGFHFASQRFVRSQLAFTEIASRPSVLLAQFEGGVYQTHVRKSLGKVSKKTMAAPVTVIIAYDLKFCDKLPRLFPHYPAMRDMFVNNPQLIQETALRNSTLQGAYMILAARALGLDCGPMSG